MILARLRIFPTKNPQFRCGRAAIRDGPKRAHSGRRTASLKIPIFNGRVRRASHPAADPAQAIMRCIFRMVHLIHSHPLGQR